MTFLNRTAGREPESRAKTWSIRPFWPVLILFLALGTFQAPANVFSADIKALISALNDPSPKTRTMAARELGLLGAAAKPAIDHLISAMDDGDRIVQKEASLALRNIGPEAVPALRRALANSNPRLREGAALALGKMGSEANQAVPDLVRMLTDREYDVKNAAEFALRRLGQPALAELNKAKKEGGPLGDAAEKLLIKMGR